MTVSMKEITAAVAQEFGVSVEDMRGPRRHRRECYPRFVAMWLCSKLGEHSLNEIGAFFNRDHTTVMSGLQRLRGLSASDADLRGSMDRLHDQLRAQGMARFYRHGSLEFRSRRPAMKEGRAA